MAIDPRIALGFQGIDVGAILQNAQQFQQRKQEMENQRYLMDRRTADDAREDDYRSALGDILTGNGSFAQPRGNVPAEAGPSPQERAMRADPEKYLSFQGKRLDITADQLKGYRDLNDTAMQLLGGVNDQASYDRAKEQAKAIYAQNGADPSVIDKLPPEYSPEVVKSLQMQGMDTAHQLLQVARENKINWDEYDDQVDNERADKSLQELSGYREQRIAAQKREQDLVDARTRRGQDMSSADRRESVRQRAEAARMRGSGNPARVSAGDGAIIKNPKTGQRLMLKNGQWVPVK